MEKMVYSNDWRVFAPKRLKEMGKEAKKKKQI